MKHDFHNAPTKVCDHWPVRKYPRRHHRRPASWTIETAMGNWVIIVGSANYLVSGPNSRLVGFRKSVEGAFALVERDIVRRAYRCREFAMCTLGRD